MGEIASKLSDAALMFWQACDERERRIVVYAAAYLVVTVAITMQRGSRERLRRELREELLHGAHAS